ncbi:hypothetical protein POM88_025285 [Heracleum sosnowskyi]|uniref:AAA+ ATPase domain-containing protein n=1 Tax=Heracleum sosnowskyi TaxID=360622 RepID=A0AAD8MMA2_9APIA|nr:hypothetical protein POM88_025285 [Heracleum sosnowskyi]
MTRAVRDRILKDANGDISDHLRNHIHLTNCIHLKNHMHKQSPILSDRSIVRDLVVLQRSRSLRDPSMSPPSWNSPSASGFLSRRVENDVLVGNGRWSIGIEHRRDGREFFGSSPPLANIPMSDVARGEVSMHNDEVPAVSDRSRKSGVRERGRSKREESVGRNLANDLLHGKDETPVEENALNHGTYLGKAGLRSQKHNQKGRRKQDDRSRTLPENGHEVQNDSDDVASSHNHHYRRHAHHEGPFEEAQTSVHGHFNSINRGRRRKLRGARKIRNAVAAREAIAHYEMSVASNSLPHGAERGKYQMEESGEEYGDPNVTKAPGNGCGIPWNWSRIHHRGKSFLDTAGRSLSCGLSDSKSRKGGPLTQGEFSNMSARSDHSSSSSKFDGETLPLLIDDHDSSDNAAWVHDYSGPVISRSFNCSKLALSNAVVKRKVGSLYVFYGPHGTGKTSCARIFARALNCQSMEHPKPCGVCASCNAHDKGRSQYIQEVGHGSRSQWIATKEDLEIDKDAVKLIASRSDGSLRDAEMTLDQLSLLGQKISILLVQELVGLVSDEKLVDLLDLAFSADTVNIVKNLREIMESGVEPLALMSQLATVITDILAGSYDIMKGRFRRKFFRRQPLSKEDMKRLRHALKTLSEAEKQLRMSNDRLTWLTAALLQLAPDQQYNLPSSPANTSFNQSPLALNTADGSDRLRSSNVQRTDIPNNAIGLSTNSRMDNLQAGSFGSNYNNVAVQGRTSLDRKEYDELGMIPQQTSSVAGHHNRVKKKQLAGKFHQEIEEIWIEVLEKIHINSIREFLYQEGKLVGVSFGAAGSIVHLTFSSHLMQSKAEKFMAHILRAFEYVLGAPVKIEIKCESRVGTLGVPLVLPASQDRSPQMYANLGVLGINRMPIDSTGAGRSEIVEIEASPRQPKDNEHFGNMQSAKRIQPSEYNQNKSIVKRKVSLAHIIQQSERGSQRNGWSKRKAISIAEKLEQENLRLEPRSRSYLCWKASKLTHKRLSRFKVRPRKPKALLKFVSCGKCMSARSPR